MNEDVTVLSIYLHQTAQSASVAFPSLLGQIGMVSEVTSLIGQIKQMTDENTVQKCVRSVLEVLKLRKRSHCISRFNNKYLNMGLSVRWFDVQSNPMCLVLEVDQKVLQTYCDTQGLSFVPLLELQTNLSKQKSNTEEDNQQHQLLVEGKLFPV